MDRIEEMKDFLRDAEKGMLEERIRMMKAYCKSHENIRQEIVYIIDGVIMNHQDGCVVISYLRSSYITGSHAFCIAQYTDEPFVEEEPDSMYYSMRVLFEGVEDDCKKLNKLLESKYIRIMASEKEEIRRWHMEHIYSELYDVFKLMLADTKYKEIYYGGYMDEVRAL